MKVRIKPFQRLREGRAEEILCEPNHVSVSAAAEAVEVVLEYLARRRFLGVERTEAEAFRVRFESVPPTVAFFIHCHIFTKVTVTNQPFVRFANFPENVRAFFDSATVYQALCAHLLRADKFRRTAPNHLVASESARVYNRRRVSFENLARCCHALALPSSVRRFSRPRPGDTPRELHCSRNATKKQ
jgi:hypothetical protein